MENTGCKIICGAPTTLAVKGLMMMKSDTERCVILETVKSDTERFVMLETLSQTQSGVSCLRQVSRTQRGVSF